jgi:uncharacterized damage-inducible protein DinB
MDEQVLDTWRIHNRITLYVLDAISPEALGGVSASKGRTVGAQFAHMHNNRIAWLEAAAPDLTEGLAKIDKASAGDREMLREALEGSGNAVGALLGRGIEAGGKIKGFKPHAVAFMAYLIAHESYHQGEIGMILNQSGHALDKKTAYGMWEWGTR